MRIKSIIGIAIMAVMLSMPMFMMSNTHIVYAATSGSLTARFPLKYTAGLGNYTDTLPASGTAQGWVIPTGPVNATFSYHNTSALGSKTITSFAGVIYANDTTGVQATTISYGVWDSNATLIATGTKVCSLNATDALPVTLTAVAITASAIPISRAFNFTLCSDVATTKIWLNSTTYPSYFSLTLTGHIVATVTTDTSTYKYSNISGTQGFQPITSTITVTNALGVSDIDSVRNYFDPEGFAAGTIALDDNTNASYTVPYTKVYTYTYTDTPIYANKHWTAQIVVTDNTGNTLTDPSPEIYIEYNTADEVGIGQRIIEVFEAYPILIIIFLLLATLVIAASVIVLHENKKHK
jgi:hypothetical protein